MNSRSHLLLRGLTGLRYHVFRVAGTSRAFEGEMGDVEWISWGNW